MTITIYELDNGLGNLIYGEGELTAEEYYHETMQHLSKPEAQLKKYIYSIVDYTQVTHAQIGLNYITKIAKKAIEVSKINPEVIVVLAASNNIVYGLAKIWCSLAKMTGWNMNVFKTREKADSWIQNKVKEKHGEIELKYSL